MKDVSERLRFFLEQVYNRRGCTRAWDMFRPRSTK
jgi:hypothetical protein